MNGSSLGRAGWVWIVASIAVASVAGAQEPPPPAAADAPSEDDDPEAGDGPEATSESGDSPDAPNADPRSDEDVAKQQASAGRAFYQAGNYVSALSAFRTAYDLQPTAALIYNIARCHERLSQWAEAVDAYKRYVELESDPRERSDALDKISVLEQRAGGAGGDDQYEARMMSGRRAYQKGDFEAAIEDFQAAFAEKPEPAPLYNIAKSFEKMARYEDALDYYRQYLEADPNAPDKADVESIMKRLASDIRSRFQELSISSDPPGADVYLDDRNEGIIGQTNLRTKLRPGPHTLYIDLNGYDPVRRDFVMSEDKPLALEFDLKKLENVGYVTIAVDQPGARIFVDGAIVGLSPYTQTKALPAGDHQIQVELVGFDRYSEPFVVEREATTAVDVRLNKYSPPVSDGTLSDWGRNLVLFGLIGGGLGFGGPILYQEFILDRPYFTDLGPSDASGRPFYDGSEASRRPNDDLDTLETVQMVSLIAGGTLVVSGLVVYMYKWLRTTPPPPVAASLGPPPLEITGFGLTPTAGGAGVGLTGRF